VSEHDESMPTHETGGQVGGVHRKVDAMERMRGVTRYTDDLKLPRMLHAKIKRCPHPHAKILSIDASAALAMPGVHAVITGKDLPTPYGIIPWTPDETALCVEKALYVGDGIACVAADDEDTAIEALEKIDVKYEVLEPLFDPEQALERRDNQINPYSRKGNLSKKVLLEFGDIEGTLEKRRSRRAQRRAHSVVGHAGLALSAPRAGEGLGHAGQSHPGDSASARGRLRGQVGAVRPRVLRGQARADDGPTGQAALHP
jgi:CO/xanthine dehydrogenase Mo-binding subunit